VDTLGTSDHYLKWERLAETRSEYIDGVLRARDSGSLTHDRIVGNLLGYLHKQNTFYEPFTSAMRVQLARSRFVYPDVTVVCGTPTFTDADVDTLVNPTVIFEVLSDSTLNYDLGEKARLYRQRDSLKSLCLVAQDRPWVEVWTREEGSSWRVREFTGLESAAELPVLSLTLPLAELYRRIAFTEQNP
jgi:Uma2 family endonuclease